MNIASSMPVKDGATIKPVKADKSVVTGVHGKSGVHVFSSEINTSAECRRAGIATRASTVDHILAKAHGGTDDDFNLEALCWPCHRTKTARERLR